MDDSKGNHGRDQEPTHEHLRADAAAGDEKPKQEPVVVVAPPPEYPQRPWEPDCSYYLKFGRCGYGTTCMFNHPPIRPSSAIAGGGGGGVVHQQGQETTTAATEFPQRSGEADCSYYVKFGRCKYGMSCMFNHPPPRKLVGFPATAGVCKCNHHQVEQVELNSLGLPLRPAAGLCSYYMHKGICKFGANCRFHHPDRRSESEQESGSSQNNFFSRLGDIFVTPEPDLTSPIGPPPLELPTPFLLRPSSKEPPVQVYPWCQEQSGGHQQLGDSHFEPAKPVRYRYTRDQLLQLREAQQIVHVSKDIFELKQCVDMELHDDGHSWDNNDSNVNTRSSYHRYDLADSREWRPWSSVQTPAVDRKEKYSDNIHEAKDSYGSGGKQERFCVRDQLCCFKFDSKAQVIVDCENFPFAALENTILEDRQESSSTAPEISLVVNTTASKECFCGSSDIGKVDKDVHKKCDPEILRKSLTKELSSAESKKNYMHEEFKRLVELSENACPSNSMASMQIDQVRCSFSEILELICRCWSCGGHG